MSPKSPSKSDQYLEGLYVLEGKTFRPARSYMEWGVFMSFEGKPPYYRHVLRDYFYIGEVEYCNLSTVFLGIDHSFSGGTPVLFESMIFGGDLNESQERYTSWDEAEVGHVGLQHSIIKAINRKFKIATVGLEKDGKESRFYFKTLVEGYVKFTGDDMRLIREN